MLKLYSKVQKVRHDADRQFREQFTHNTEDTKIQDELLCQLTDKSTPDDPLNITRKVETQRAQKHANGIAHKEFNNMQC